MKHVLSLLLTFVFLNVSSWAYAPNYGTVGTSAQGTYAGVLIPVNEVTTTSASIGVFAVGVPSTQSDFVLGAGVLFSQGAAYNSIITGILDPATSTITAVIEGQATVASLQLAGGGFPTQSLNSIIFAQGNFIAKIKDSGAQTLGASGPGTASAARLKGTASIDLFAAQDATTGAPIITGTVQYTINGFQQSSTYMVPAITVTLGGPSTGG